MSLKNILTVMQPDQLDGTPPPIPSDAAAKLKGAQLSSGRARATLESQTAALREAKEHLERARQDHGEKVLDGVGADASARALQVASLAVQHLEASVPVARQRADEADTARKAAELAVTAATRHAARLRVAALAPEGEQLLAAVKQFSERLARETDALRQAGANGQYPSGSREIREQFELSLSIAATGNRPPDRLMKYPRWGDCVTAICGS